MFVSRSQADSLAKFEEWSDEAGISFPVEEDRTRQEFAEESDVNNILRRFGAGGFEMRPVMYGTQDTDADLQTVYMAASVAQDAWAKLPEPLRKRYPGWPELLVAMEAGEASLVDPDGVVSVPDPAPPAGGSSGATA